MGVGIIKTPKIKPTLTPHKIKQKYKLETKLKNPKFSQGVLFIVREIADKPNS